MQGGCIVAMYKHEQHFILSKRCVCRERWERWSSRLWGRYDCRLLQRGRLSPSGLYFTHIHLRANHLCVPGDMLALWLSGCGSGRVTGTRTAGSALPHTRPVSSTRCPAVCCSFIAAQAICAMATVPACQLRHRFHLSSRSLPAWWLSSSCRASASSLLNLTDTPSSSDKVVFCHSLL